MTWQAKVEIYPSKSKNYDAVIEFGKDTASEYKEEEKKIVFIYNKDKCPDLGVMLARIWQWKGAFVYVNDHAITIHYLHWALECMLYDSNRRVCKTATCKLCPAYYDRCKKKFNGVIDIDIETKSLPSMNLTHHVEY